MKASNKYTYGPTATLSVAYDSTMAVAEDQQLKHEKTNIHYSVLKAQAKRIQQEIKDLKYPIGALYPVHRAQNYELVDWSDLLDDTWFLLRSPWLWALVGAVLAAIWMAIVFTH